MQESEVLRLWNSCKFPQEDFGGNFRGKLPVWVAFQCESLFDRR